MITEKDIRHVATLARLELKDEEVPVYTKQIQDILGYFKQLDQFDDKSLEPLMHGQPLPTKFREDVVVPSPSVKEILKNAPNVEADAYVVPVVVEGD